MRDRKDIENSDINCYQELLLDIRDLLMDKKKTMEKPLDRTPLF